MGKTGLQREMDVFFKEIENADFSIRKITKGGFSKSRMNLAPETFLELNDVIQKDFYQQVDWLGYKGHRLLAVDGSWYSWRLIQNSLENISYYFFLELHVKDQGDILAFKR